MKVLVIGGNRFVGLRLTHQLSTRKDVDLTIVNRTGQAPHATGATVYKADRGNWTGSHVDKDWDVIVDFACFTDQDALGSLEYFKSVGRYVFISTIAVYDPGPSIPESSFDAGRFDLKSPALGTYQDGKRRAEAAFVQRAQFPVLHVRFPLILGPDDYTRRLEFHVNRIERGQPLHFPNPQARLSMIHAEDACRFLEFSLSSNAQGPLNVTAKDPIALTELVARIEKALGRKALLASAASEQNESPYGWPDDLFADTTRLQKLGFTARPIIEWIDDLIDEARQGPAPSRLH